MRESAVFGGTTKGLVSVKSWTFKRVPGSCGGGSVDPFVVNRGGRL